MTDTKQQTISAQQARIHAEAAGLQQVLNNQRSHDRATAAIVLAELEQTFPELRSAAYRDRDAWMQAQADYDAAHAQAHQHATTPPESRAAIDAWVEQGGVLDRRVVGLGHLLKQAEAAESRSRGALDQAVQQLVQQRRYTAVREFNTRRRAMIAGVQQRQAELEAWAKTQGDALNQFLAEALYPLEQVVREGLVSGQQLPEMTMDGLFRIDD
jgi:hypothetical protein